MTLPLALVLYERLLPGSQLVNRLQDLHYRTETLTDSARLVEVAADKKPMLVFADLAPDPARVCTAIRGLRSHSTTSHLPVIVFGLAEEATAQQQQAQDAGATLVVGETALLSHLPQFLDQALQIE